MNSRTAITFCLASTVLLTGLSTGQDFVTLYRRAEERRLTSPTDGAAQRAAYSAAVHAFARLTDSAERTAALPDAAAAALQAGDAARAAMWIGESIALGHDDATHAEVQVQALALSGQARAAVDAIAAWSPRRPEAVLRALAAVQARVGGALCEAADVALREGQTQVGLTTFAQMVQASNRQPIALANLALALRHVGRDAEAEATYRQAIAAAPDDSDLWNDLGLLLKGQRRDEEAVAAFAKSLALETHTPPSGPATSNLVTMARAGRGGDSTLAPRDDSRGCGPRVAALAGVLARVPDAGMARHLLLRELVDPPFLPPRADTQVRKR